jgi:hypothetical protein
VDSRSLIFAAKSEELNDIITASQTAKLLRHPEAEAYLFIVRKENQSEPDVQPINFASNELLMRGYLPTVSTSRPDPLRAVPTEIKQLLEEFEGCFREELLPELPPSRGQEYTIDTGDATPINLNSYPLSSVYLKGTVATNREPS